MQLPIERFLSSCTVVSDARCVAIHQAELQGVFQLQQRVAAGRSTSGDSEWSTTRM